MDFRPHEIVSDGEQLWALSDSSAGYIDLRTGERYIFSRRDGLPKGTLTCIAFNDDYIWIGGSRGVSRFDRLIEQWENIPLPSSGTADGIHTVSKIELVDQYAYFATDGGILRFDNRTETFTIYSQADGLQGAPYRDIIRMGDELWFCGDNGIDIYSTTQQNWSFLGVEDGFRSTDWRRIAEIGGNLYFLHENIIDICEPANRQIYPFERENRLKDYTVNDFFGSTTGMWFATNQGLLYYQLEVPSKGQAEDWILFDRSRGAADPDYLRLGSARGVLFGRGRSALDVLDLTNKRFLSPLYYPREALSSTGIRRQPVLRWDEKGLRINPAPTIESGMEGSANYLIETDGETSEHRFWGRLQPYLKHSSGRSLSGLYDNRDPREILYGITYRGKDGDFLRRAEGGNRVTFAQTYDPFFGKTTLRGGSAALEIGPRSERKRRSLLRGEITAGELITHSEREFFNGGQGPIYTLKHQDLLIGSAVVYLNGTRLSASEFALSYTLGNFWLTFPGWELLNEGDVIEVEYQYRLSETEIGEPLTAGEIVLSGGDQFQVAVSGFEKGSSQVAQSDSSSQAGFRGTQITGEARGNVIGGDGELIVSVGASGQTDDIEARAEATSLEANFNRGPWTFHSLWSTATDTLATLENRDTEFGGMLGEDLIKIHYEPSGKLRLDGETASQRGENGSERRYHCGGQWSPIGGTSTFGTLDYFDADAADLNRERWIASAGMETVFSPALLRRLKLRSSRLYIISRFSEVHLDSLLQADSSRIDLRTRSLLTRWAIVPNAKLRFYPEIRWSYAERAVDGQSYQLYREEFAPRSTFYTRNLIPGLTSYFDLNALYRQADFQADASRNLGFERQGVAQIDLTPGTYASLFDPISIRLNLARNAADSLLSIGEERDLFDIGFRWRDYPTNVLSDRFDADAVQMTWALHSNWLFYQSVSEVRSTSAPTEQFFSTRLEWKPHGSDQVYWKYTLKRTFAPAGAGWDHHPGVEWYRRWSSDTYTRSQIYITYTDDAYQKSYSVSPGGYLDQRFTFPWKAGDGEYRMELSATYLQQTIPDNDQVLSFGGYGRIDWDFNRILRLRLRCDEHFEYSITQNTSSSNWMLEFRLTAQF